MRNIIPLWLKKEKFLFAAGLSLVLSVNLYLRSFPVNFPQLKTQAKEIVRQIVQQQAMTEVQKKFPQFYYSAKDAIVQSEMKQYYKANRKNIDKQVNELYSNMKSRYQDDAGQTYLMELDCWHWGRYVENVLKYGHPGDEVIGGRQWDMFMLAPTGFFMNWEHFLFYSSAALYKLFSVFKAAPLFTFIFYLPLLFAAVFIAALYFFSYKFSGNLGAVITSLFVGLAPIFLPRSSAGWFDMDILNLLFPVVIVWTYILSIEKTARGAKIFWIGVSAFFVGLFAFTWVFWWFIFVVIVIYEIISLGWQALFCFYRKEKISLLSQRAFLIVLFLAVSSAWVAGISGTGPFAAAARHIKQSFILNKPLLASVWPNVYSTVGELRKMNINEISRTVGETWITWISLFSMVVLGLRAVFSKVMSDSARSAIGIIIIWFLAMVFATSRGVRFTVFLLVPMAIALGWGINETYSYLKSRHKFWGVFFAGAAVCAVFLALAPKGYAVARSIYPLMDDTWYKVLNLVKEKTPQETIINSWWDFGDWFKVVSRRRVIFDGQSQDTSQAYWMAKAMLSHNEEESAAILRMLNNGGNKAFEIMNGHINNELQAVLLLEYALTLPQDKADDVLKKFLPDASAQIVSKIIFSKPASAVFAVDHTMPFKMPAISYLGNWNFAKVYIAQNLNKLEKNQLVEYLKSVRGDDPWIQTFYQEAFLITANKLDEWLSARMQFYSALLNGTDKNGQIYFDNGFIYNISDSSLRSNSSQILRSVFVFKNDNLTEIINPQANVNFSALVYETKGGYKLIFLDRELANSLFVRLYFLEGKGLRHFSPFIESEEGNNYIRFFAINW